MFLRGENVKVYIPSLKIKGEKNYFEGSIFGISKEDYEKEVQSEIAPLLK